MRLRFNWLEPKDPDAKPAQRPPARELKRRLELGSAFEPEGLAPAPKPVAAPKREARPKLGLSRGTSIEESARELRYREENAAAAKREAQRIAAEERRQGLWDAIFPTYREQLRRDRQDAMFRGILAVGRGLARLLSRR